MEPKNLILFLGNFYFIFVLQVCANLCKFVNNTITIEMCVHCVNLVLGTSYIKQGCANSRALGRFHRVKRITNLVEASTKTARLILKQQSFYNRRFAVLVEASSKTVNLLTRWNLPTYCTVVC